METNRLYTTEITLRNGRAATVRPLEATDVDALTTFFLSLSEQTRSRYGPHPFDRPTAEKLCASIDNNQTVRFIASLNDGTTHPEFIGYMILTRQIWPDDQLRYGGRLRPTDRGCFAPVIADAYQEQGIGTQMAGHVLASARAMGLKQVILMGGVIADNHRARRLYERLGFRYMGKFWTVSLKRGILLNYNMMIEFPESNG